jgi:hypothetical protein
MGKRSNFERREADFYPTPRAAVAPLIPYLRGVRTFAEPCAGDGALVGHLEACGLRCVYQGDIRNGHDALACDSYGGAPVITNPPYDTEHHRKLMHAMILHFMRAAPFVWLLIDFDWSATKQAAPFLLHCSDIVAIGRVKWIEGSKHTGKDNSAWYRFDARHAAGPVFHWRDQGEPARRTRACENCRKPYEPQRSSGRFRSERCRQAAHRRLRVTLSVTSPAVSEPRGIG